MHRTPDLERKIMPDSDIDPGLGLSSSDGGLHALSRAASFFMTATGQKSGKIKGGSTIKGREGQIELLGIEQFVKSPRDAASGLPTGRRIHHPLQVAAKLDKSAPLLWNALVMNENLTEVKIDCWGGISKASGIASGSGNKVYYTVKLTHAQLCEFQHFTAVDGTLCFVAAFTFQKIEWTWTDGGINAQDDWLSPAT